MKKRIMNKPKAQINKVKLVINPKNKSKKKIPKNKRIAEILKLLDLNKEESEKSKSSEEKG